MSQRDLARQTREELDVRAHDRLLLKKAYDEVLPHRYVPMEIALEKARIAGLSRQVHQH